MKTFRKADILLPQNTEYAKWSVVACDQYTSEPNYWGTVSDLVCGSPSSYHITFPEIYLGDGDAEERIKNINSTMDYYLEADYLKEIGNSYIYVKRTLDNGKVRRGIIGAVDLEDYDYTVGAQSYIRATEGTVLERIPPRVKIRENASLEVPHVMLLIDNDMKTVIEPLDDAIDNMEIMYDFELMQHGGHITGYRLNSEEEARVCDALDALADQEAFDKKYAVKGKGVLLFAVGDGNHSLATAKTCWENIKKNLSADELEGHPARYALVEVVNLHDSSFEFEPIHRVLFDVDPDKVINEFMKFYKGDAAKKSNGGQNIKYIYGGKKRNLYVKNAPSNLAVGTLQKFLDFYIEKFGGRIDYIHGEDVVRKLSDEKGNIGFLLPCMGKSELFKTVITDGVLPRKTFSIGEAKDKRFYLECKKIK